MDFKSGNGSGHLGWRLGGWLAQFTFSILVLVLIVFVLTQVAPGDAARLRLGPRASQEEVDVLRKQLGLDQNILVQFGSYVGRLARADLGTSINGEPVSDVIRQRIDKTLWLLAGTSVLSLALSFPLAWLSAYYRDRTIDHVIRFAVLVALFMPVFWIGFLLIRFLALPTGWFPVAGLGSSPMELLRSLVLPCLTGAIAMAPILVRSLRSSLIEVISADHVTVARSLGIRGSALLFRHILRNALGPTIALFSLNVGYLFFGIVILETTFAIHGLGSQLVTASIKKDVNVVQAITIIFAAGVVLANSCGDLVVRWLDPRQGSR